MSEQAGTPLLGIHVLNRGIGESIVVELPDGNWGVVDCYASGLADRDRNPTYRLLQERAGLQPKLVFLCLTHPDSDHYRGMSHLLALDTADPERHPPLQIDEFWIFDATSPLQLAYLADYLRLRARADGDAPAGASAEDFMRSLELVMRRSKAGHLTRRYLLLPRDPLYSSPVATPSGDVVLQVEAAAPTEKNKSAYEDALQKCFPDGRFDPAAAKLHANMISAALLIQYGDTRIVLGGDVENDQWPHITAYAGRGLGARLRAVHAVKVPHHGSRGANDGALWQHLGPGREPRAVVTPYRSQGLPTADIVDLVLRSSTGLATTCPTAMPASGLGLAAEVALRSHMPTAESPRDEDWGRCSLWFGPRGDLVRHEVAGGAAWLSGP